MQHGALQLSENASYLPFWSVFNLHVFIYIPVDSSLSQRPLQLQKAGHRSSALTFTVHLIVQPLSNFHPHFNSSWQLFDAFRRFTNSGSQTWLALHTQLYSLGHGRGCDGTNALPGSSDPSVLWQWICQCRHFLMVYNSWKSPLNETGV